MYADNPKITGIHFGNNQHAKPTITEIEIRLINRGNLVRRELPMRSPWSIRYEGRGVRGRKCQRGRFQCEGSIDFPAWLHGMSGKRRLQNCQRYHRRMLCGFSCFYVRSYVLCLFFVSTLTTVLYRTYV